MSSLSTFELQFSFSGKREELIASLQRLIADIQVTQGIGLVLLDEPFKARTLKFMFRRPEDSPNRTQPADDPQVPRVRRASSRRKN